MSNELTIERKRISRAQAFAERVLHEKFVEAERKFVKVKMDIQNKRYRNRTGVYILHQKVQDLLTSFSHFQVQVIISKMQSDDFLRNGGE